MSEIKLSRMWEMPNKWTFKMKAVQELLYRYDVGKGWADPFCGLYSPAEWRNDIEAERNATHHMDGLDFLKSFADGTVRGVLFDPPYSVDQNLRNYQPKQAGTAGRTEYQARCKDEIGRILAVGGHAISFGWDSSGMGRKRGCTVREVRLICHGACHQDTIITVDEKLPPKPSLFEGQQWDDEPTPPAS